MRSTAYYEHELLNYLQETMQCAGGAGRGACNGDSGGPLVCRQEETGRWYQVRGQATLVSVC